MKRYYVNYYPADGSGPIPDDQMPELHGQGFMRKSDALRAILAALGGVSFGTWNPPDDGELPPGHESVIAFHESEDEGCGGYELVRFYA